MSLITAQGRGFLISDGVELQYSKAGTAWARLPLSFRNSRKTDDGKWTYDKEILVEGVVFGALAESLAEVVDGRTDLNVVGDLYTEEYEGKVKVRRNVRAVWPANEVKPALASASSAKASNDYPF